MALNLNQDYLAFIVIGFMLGIFVTWIYNKQQNKTKHLAKIIEGAIIGKKVSEISELSKYLDQIVTLLRRTSDELNEQIKLTRDIEIGPQTPEDEKQNFDEEDLKKNIEILEKNL